jgi:outer membrane protein OmpA-like peptidoglycan-associated protein
MLGAWRVRRFQEEICLIPRLGGASPPSDGTLLDPGAASFYAARWFPDDADRGALLEIVDHLDRYISTYTRSAATSWLVTRVSDALRERRLEAYVVPLAVLAGSAGGGAATKGTEDKASPPSPPVAEKKLTWFEVAVTDAWGEPVEGIALELSWQGTKSKAETGSDGKARIDDVPGSSGLPGSARFANSKAVRASVRPRYGKKEQPKELPDVENPKRVALRDEMNDTSIRSEAPVTLVLWKPLTRVRLIGMHFDTGKCFLRETAMRGIRRVVEVYKAIPNGKLLIAGHTDTSGAGAYNLDLSVERAASVKAFVKDDVAAWEAWFGADKPNEQRWGNREVRSMIAALPCEQTVAGFQQWSNDSRGTSLVVDSDAGPKTRKALIEAYMALDGTTLPDAIGAEIHGCGELFPLADAGDNFGKDSTVAAEDRRVEIFCFDDEVHPPVPGEKATEGEPEYDQWKKQVTDNIDVGATPSTDDVGKIWMELWDKTGQTPRAGVAYQISGDGAYAGATDGLGRLLHENVPQGDYRITVDGLTEDSAALVLPTADDEPQIRFLQ